MHISYVYEGTIPSQRAAFIQILSTSRALCEHGVSVTVYADSIAAPSDVDCLAFYGLMPHPLLQLRARLRRGGQRLTWPFRLGRILRSRPAGERHVIMSRGEPGVALHTLLRWMPRPANVRFVYEAHRLCFTQVSKWYAPTGPLSGGRQAWATARMRAAERTAVEQADGVVCLTAGVRDALAELFSLTAPTLILPSGTAPSPARVPDDAGRDLDIFYAGKLERRKGVYDLVESMRFLPEAHCWIAGGAEDDVRELQETVEAGGVADRVTLLGFVPPAEVEDLYKRARVGVCSLPEGVSMVSERYTSPMKILNMMACRTPIVATNLPSIREVLEDGKTALLAPPNNPRALAEAVKRLLDDRALAFRLATAASEAVKCYTWTERALRLRDFLRTLP